MVVSKRCKICTVLDTSNVPIAGEYFGKQIPEIILKISGVELDPRKANDVLICQPCVIQLVHTDVVIDKLKNAVQRLKKNVRDAKLKTPLKKNVDLNKTASENVEKQSIKCDGDQCKSDKDCEPVAEKVLNTPKKIVRRKSVYMDEKTQNPVDESKQNGKTNSKEKCIKKSPGAKRKSMSSTIETDKSLSMDNTIDTSTVKRIKGLSTSEESPMDLTIEEQDCNGTNNEAVIEQIKEKARNCILCDKMFQSKRALRDHIETAHMGERLKACPHCSSEFRSLQKYESHVFSEKCKSTNHPCQDLNCSKRFKTVHKMELHMQQKHSSQNATVCVE